MKTIFKIARTELRTLFYSPIAWFLLIAFFVQCSTDYVTWIKIFAGTQEIGGDDLKQMKFLTENIFGGDYGIFVSMMQKLYLFIPLITMGLLSRETSSGTIKLLYSSPVSVTKIVSGKFVAMMLFNLVVIGLMCVFIVSGIFHIKNADTGMLLSCALGLYLLLCTYSAIGLFMSALTSYQVVAAVCTFLMIGMLTYVGRVWQDIEFVRDITYFLSLQGRTAKMMSGLISSQDVMYFVTICYLFIGITICRMKAGRESKPFLVKAGRYLAVIVSGLTIGYFSTFPVLTVYLDTTRQQTQTLTPNAKKIIKELTGGPLEIITYNNVLGRAAWSGFPQQQKRTLSMWDRYLRFKPDMKFSFIQYYDEPLDFPEPFSTLYPGRTMKQVVEDYANTQGMKMEEIKSPEQIKKVIDLRPELNRYVMLLKWKGRSTILRTYDDPAFFPSETEVSAAFKRLLKANVPKIAFMSGNLERSIHKAGAREYKTITNNPVFRWSLVNQGFDTDTINLDIQEIPGDITALVLADPKTTLSDVALSKLERYINEGGNIMIAGEPGKQSVINPLLQKLNVQLLNGIVAQPSAQLTPDIALGRITQEAGRFTSELIRFVTDSVPVAMAGATGVVLNDSVAFKPVPLLLTNPKKSWLKTGAMVVDSADIVFNSIEDKRMEMTLTLGLTRKINNKEQRIIITGDADFMSNADLNRFDVENTNFAFSTALFSWLNYGEFPIDTSRPDSIDNRMSIGMSSMLMLKLLYVWIIPALLIIFGSVLLIRRNRK